MKVYLILLFVVICSCVDSTAERTITQKERFLEINEVVDRYFQAINTDSLKWTSLKSEKDYESLLNQSNARTRLRTSYITIIDLLSSAVTEFDSIEYQVKIQKRIDSLKFQLHTFGYQEQ